MANRYWVLGNGTWNLSATTNWSATSGGSGGASAPTYLDDVYFDTNSNVGTGVWTVTLDTAATCANFNVIYPDGALTIDKGTLNVNTLTVYGSYNIALSTGTGAANFLTIGTGLIKFVITTQSSSVFSLTVPSSSEKTLIGKNNQTSGTLTINTASATRNALGQINVSSMAIEPIDIGSSYKTSIGKNNQTGGTLTLNTASATRNALGPTNISSLPILTTISTASTATISYNVFALGYNRVVYIETLAGGTLTINTASATRNALGQINVSSMAIEPIDIGSSYKTSIGKNNQLGSIIVVDIGSSIKTSIGKNNQTGGTLTINTASATRNALGIGNVSSLPILTTISTASTATISYNVFAPGYNRVVYIETLAPGPTLNNITSATLVSKNALGLINIPKIIVSENWSPFPTINNITSATLVGRDAFSKNDSPKNIIFEKFVPVPIIVNNTNITTIRGLINQVGSTLNLKPVNIYEKFGETITNGITPLPYQFWG